MQDKEIVKTLTLNKDNYNEALQGLAKHTGKYDYIMIHTPSTNYIMDINDIKHV